MKKLYSVIISLALLLSFSVLSFAEGNVSDIKTYEDLLKIKENPSGSYKLINDIDCSGHEWTPFDFSGTLDGNGFAIMNLSIKDTGTTTKTTLDGNRKEYETYFAGMFCAMENATVKNLYMPGVKVEITKDDNTYIGSIAGYMENSTIENCTVEGELWLTSSCKSFGVGGILGYGSGTISSTKAVVTLVCIDTDIEWKDEQFMGGIFANGYPDVKDCTVIIKGYDSDHGFVHDGGIAGMYMSPRELKITGHIDNNKVTGFIRFFEDNINRRAYCVGDVGEIMNYTLTREGNDIAGFERLETKDYSKNLYPNMCENPQYEETVKNAKEGEYGYILHSCKTCDYSFKSNYTSLNVFREEPVTEKESEEQKPAVENTETQKQAFSIKSLPVIITAVCAVALVVLMVIAVILIRSRKKQRYIPKRGRK